MTEPNDRLIRNVSDTARWVAVYRAMETERADALFRDPFAKRLMGERGPRIVEAAGRHGRATWPFVVRTLVFDQFIAREIAIGCDQVINLAAGLDARPYRMDLPPDLQWVEIDLPEILEEKTAVLRNDTPRCKLERIALDLADETARAKVFAELGARSRRTLIVSEGLIVYLSSEQVAGLAQSLARQTSFSRWIVELSSPGLLKMLQRGMGRTVRDAGAPFLFAPQEGPQFFVPHGWKPIDVQSMFQTGVRLKRVPFLWRVVAQIMPEKNPPPPNRPWAGVCVFENSG